MGTLITINQDADTPARREITPAAVLTYLYDRSRDSKRHNGVGQDFIAYCSDNHRIAFAVCDGVSQSFYGDLAARFLGEGLTRWLFGLSTDQLKELVQDGRTEDTPFFQTDRATGIVRAKPISRGLPPMVRDALLRKRENGSETMFVAGLVNQETMELTTFWMGDMRLWLWDRDGHPVELPGAVWDTKERWSTRVGPKNGSPRWAVMPLDNIARITVHSDGIMARASDLDSITLEKLDQIARDLGELPASDDVSILDIALGSVDIESENGPLPAPILTLPEPAEAVIQWEPIDRAEWYRVQLGMNELQWTIDVDTTAFFISRAEREDRPADLLEGHFEYRVQAMASNRLPGELSEAIRYERPVPVEEVPVEAPVPEVEPEYVEERQIVTGWRPFRVDPLMVIALLMALIMTAGWVWMYTRGL